MTKQNSWLLTKKEAEEILQNILDSFVEKMIEKEIINIPSY